MKLFENNSNQQNMADVTDQLQVLASYIEDLNKDCSFSPQQASALREMSDLISSKIANIPEMLKKDLDTNFEHLGEQIQEMKQSHDRDNNKVLSLLEHIIGNDQSSVDKAVRSQFLDPLIRTEGDISVTKKLIGRGGSASVYLGNCDGKEVAVKVITHSNLKKEKDALEKEVMLMNACHCPSVLQVRGIAHLHNETRIALELASRGTLSALIYDKSTFPYIPFALKVWMLFDIASALTYIHARKVMHRDIKPENILLLEECHCKLTDFGIAKEKSKAILGTTRTNFSGTLAFMPPEVRSRKASNHRSDIYSLGVTAVAVILGEDPAAEQNLDLLMERVLWDVPEEVRSEMKSFLSNTLEDNMDMRISAIDAQRTLREIGNMLGGDPRGKFSSHNDRDEVKIIDEKAEKKFAGMML